MATPSLSELTPQQQHAAVTLARLAAQKEIKRCRQKQGLRETLPHSTLARLSIEWLADHPELLAEAAASPVGRKGKSPFTTHVQNGGPR